MLNVGDRAPDFSAPRDGGDLVSLSGLAGKKVVLYFYPKDDTPGCTTEGLQFSALSDDFDAENAVVLGVSRDTVKKHDKFRDKHGLTVALVSDEDGTICESFGVWVEKKNYGRSYMGIERTTFLIDEAGKIAKVWNKVRADGHAAAVLETIRG